MDNPIVKLTCGYEGTDFTRQYQFECAESLVADVKDNVLAINASLAASTSGGMHTFFLSDDGHNLKEIVDARIATVEEYPIDLNGALSLKGGN